MLRPLGERVVVKVLPAKEETHSGIIISATKEKPSTGLIVAVGKGLKDEEGEYMPLEVAIDDKVLFGKYSGTEFKDEDGNDWLIISQDDILGVL